MEGKKCIQVNNSESDIISNREMVPTVQPHSGSGAKTPKHL